MKRLVFVLATLVACGSTVVDPPPTLEPQSTGGAGGSPGCAPPFADCDGNGSCETTLGSDSNCGACGDACTPEHGTGSCEAGACVLACNDGWADCNGVGADGCEAHLGSDPDSCGACGHSCGEWGDCLLGTCVELIAAVTGVEGVVALGSNVFWSALDLYAGPDGQIGTAPEEGGLPTVLATQSAPGRLHAAGGALVWVDYATDTVFRMAASGGLPEALFAAPDARVVGADAELAYVRAGAELLGVPYDGGGPATLASGFVDVAAALRVGDQLFVADRGPEVLVMVDGFEVLGHPEGTIQSLTLATGALALVAEHLDTPSALATRDASLFWAEGGSRGTYFVGQDTENHGTFGRVVSAALDGSGASVLADGLVNPAELAADGAHLYVACAGTVGGEAPLDIAWIPDGGLGRVPLTGGAYERLLPLDAAHLALTESGALTVSWYLGLVVRVAK